MQADSRHLMLFLAPSHILLPVGKLGVYGSKGCENALAIGAAGLGEPDVYAGNISVQHPVEAACPSLHDVSLAQLGDQIPGLVALQASKWPAGKVYVGIGDHTL